MKLITRDTDYALRALCSISKKKKEITPVSFLAKELNVPGPFLRKLLQTLQNKKVLKSFKGRGGGFLLAKDPKSIFITDIMRIFQGSFCLNECFLRKYPCPNIKSCLLRKKISRIEEYVIKELKDITLLCLLKKDRR